jgi:hypothetical protein
MPRVNILFAFIFCILISLLFVASAQVGEEGTILSLPQEKGNIIVPNDASYAKPINYTGNYPEGRIYTWSFVSFSTGNGSTNLEVSAHDCNVTINSFNSTTVPMAEPDWFNLSSSLECAIAGDGVTRLDVMSFNESNIAVYVDGVFRQEAMAGIQLALAYPFMGQQPM